MAHPLRWQILAGVILFLFVSSSLPLWAEKRVAVLYFEDKSGFDSPAGCGFFPLGPLNSIFGRTRRQREYWNLEVGFRDMMLTTLRDAPGYEPISPDELMRAYANLGLDQQSLKSREARARLARELNAGALIVATIRTFKQERARGEFQRSLSGRGATAGPQGFQAASGTIGVLGIFYKADVDLDLVVYGPTGDEALTAPVEASDTQEIGAVQSGPLEAQITAQGPRAFVGSQEIIRPSGKPPVARHDVLDRVKFGVPGWDAPVQEGGIPNYRDTLLGRVTQAALDEAVKLMRDRIGPPIEKETREAALGKIAFLEPNTNDVYITLGTTAQLRPGDLLDVVREGQPITDPDTGEKLGALEEKIGVLEVLEVLRPRLSRTKVVSGEAKVSDVVRLRVGEEQSDETNAPAEAEPNEPPQTDSP